MGAASKYNLSSLGSRVHCTHKRTGAVPSWLMPRGFVSAPLEPPTKPESESEDSDEDELREEACALGTAGFCQSRWP